MHNKLMLNIAFCGLLTAHMTMTMTIEQSLPLSLEGTPRTSPLNSPRDNEGINSIPHINPLNLQSGRLSISLHSPRDNANIAKSGSRYSPRDIDPREIAELEKKEIHGIPLQNPDLEEDYIIKRSQSYGRLGYKLTYCKKDKNNEETTVICTINAENKKDMNDATHIKIQEYDQDGNLIERILKRKEKIEITGSFTNKLKKNSQIYKYISSRELNGVNYDEIIYEDNQGNQTTVNYISPDGYNGESFFVFDQCINDTWITCAIEISKPKEKQPKESQEMVDNMMTSISDHEEEEIKSWRGIFLRMPIENATCYQAISFEQNKDNYLCTITYKNENGEISIIGVDHSRELQAVHKYILIRNKNDENDSFIIKLPEQEKPIQKIIEPTSLSDNDTKLSEQQKRDALAKLAALVEEKPQSYDANLIMLNILETKGKEDSITLHYKKDNEDRWIDILLKDLPNEATSITHITEDGQKIILNLSENLDQQIYEQRQSINNLVSNFVPTLEETNQPAITPRKQAKDTKNSFAKVTTIALGVSAFAAIMIAILYQYNKLPQAFINAFNKIGIVHA